MSVIFHIDVNSAFLSWTAVEELKNGADRDLRQMNAIIGGDQASRHGIVLAKSQSAKAYGIHTGEPVANAIRKCPGLVIAKPDHKLYRECSRRLMELLRSYTPEVEQVSIDECFLDFTGIAGRFASSEEGARQMKGTIREKFGFTVNVGISTNKLLAKMASDFEKPDKVHTLFPEEIREKMWPLPVSDLFMAGKSSVETLRKLELNTIGDVAQADPEILELHLKSHGRALWRSANGLGDDQVRPRRAEAKGIGNSVTLAEDVTEEAQAAAVLRDLADKVAGRLRKANVRARMVSVEIKYADFREVSHQRQLARSTDSGSELCQEALKLFRERWSGAPVRLLGIRSSKLVSAAEPEQLSLFDPDFGIAPEPGGQKQAVGTDQARLDARRSKKLRDLDRALDKIRRKYGEDAVRRGSQTGGFD